MKCGYELLFSFGKSKISDQINLSAEKFLVERFSKSSEKNSFDDAHFETQLQISFQVDLEKIPPASSSIHIHTKRAFLQSYLWLHAPFVESFKINPEYYRNDSTEDDMSIPTITFKDVIPDTFLVSCNCLKFAKKNVCPCHVKLIRCCKFCKCAACLSCNNSLNQKSSIRGSQVTNKPWLTNCYCPFHLKTNAYTKVTHFVFVVPIIYKLYFTQLNELEIRFTKVNNYLVSK